MKRKKIAIVNQRYGLEVNGGSEYYTRLIAERLNNKYDVEVLTTKALNYTTWEDYYKEDVETINGVNIRRFSVKKKRKVFFFRLLCLFARLLKSKSKKLEELWVKEQGPYAPELIKYIEKSKDVYDGFIFVTYLYFPTAKGMAHVADKSILIPTAHDEPYIYFDIYKPLFLDSKAIVFLTEEERALVHKIFHNQRIENDVIGIGIDVPQIPNNDFREHYNIQGDYLIYVGRVDVGKGCDEMFEFFKRFKQENTDIDIKLVVIGKSVIEIPQRSDIVYLGFLSEEDKFKAIEEAKALVLPSKYESLSMSVLEAMAMSKPVIVNGKCEVLKAHCEKSSGGLYYGNYEEFNQSVLGILKGGNDYSIMCQNAKKYVEESYTWDTVMLKFEKILYLTFK